MSIIEILDKRKEEKEFSMTDVGDIRGNKRALWPRHKEDIIDRICKEQMKKGLTYADWQKERYRTTVTFPFEVKETKTFTHDIDFKEINSCKNTIYRAADFNYDRKRISADSQ